MNEATNCVEQVASHSAFPWVLFAVIVIVALVVVYKKGLFGTATTARIQKVLAKIDEEKDQWEEKLKAKLAAKTAPQAVVPQAVVAPKDKATRIADNQALLTVGTITQADFDAAKQKILAE